MFLVPSCSCLYPIHWSQVLSREWWYSWSDIVGAAPTGMLQLHLSDQQFYCLLKCALYWRLDGTIWQANIREVTYHWILKQHDPSAGSHVSISLTIFHHNSNWIQIYLILILTKRPLQNFVHDTTAMLSWRVQKFVAIWWPEIGWYPNTIAIEFELWWKNVSEIDPSCATNLFFSAYPSDTHSHSIRRYARDLRNPQCRHHHSHPDNCRPWRHMWHCSGSGRGSGRRFQINTPHLKEFWNETNELKL